ncbi:hypothetical protein D1007_25754 [Hordeum vulgare]|nr:hypothetical protein D1007_25754 [Hordeum vulgare]
MTVASPSSAPAPIESVDASALSASGYVERACVTTDRVFTTAETSANAKSAQASYHTAKVALAQVDFIQANIKNTHTKILQASSESILHSTFEEATIAEGEMHADDAAVEDMELLPHEIAERELEMLQLSESNAHREELCMAHEEIEKCVSI